MRRPSILIVTYHYLPAETPGSRRLDSVARLLAARGWRVIVLTATGNRTGERDADGIEVVRTTRSRLGADAHGHPAIASPAVARIPFVGRFARFPDKYTWWNLALVPRLLSLVRSRDIDVVFSSSPPHSLHLGVRAARAMTSFRWVAEFRDPWMFPSRRALSPSSRSVQRRWERGVLNHADRVIANTPGNRDALLAGNPRLDPGRVHVSTNGYDAAMFDPAAFPPASLDDADLTYVGEVYNGMLERYCAALAAIRERNNRAIPRLAIYGAVDASEKERIKGMGLGAFVEERGFVTHEMSVTAMKNARALLVLLPYEDRWRSCVPSKTYWYLAARRPIVAIVPEGDASALVRNQHAGEAMVDPSIEVLSRDLEDFVRRARETSMASREPDSASEYAMERVVDGLEHVLREVMDGHPA